MKRNITKQSINLFSELCEFADIKIDNILVQDNCINVIAKSKHIHSKCPFCDKKSKSVHSYYSRQLQDLPISFKAVKIQLQVRRFYCMNDECCRITFSEQVSSLTKAYSRRTTRANDQLIKMSIETSARKSSYLSNLINLPVSSSTCLRLVDSCNIPLNTDVENIGIDDLAYRKGISYGTIIVNRETGKAIDLIKSRKKEDIIKWLKKHSNIKTVTRDRSKCYSASVKSVLPEAIQIADRFHLVMNYSECIYKTVISLIPELKKINIQNYTPVLKNNTLEKEIEEIKKLAIHTEGVVSESKRLLIKEVKKLNNENLSGRKIAKLLGIYKRTVAKYIINEECQIITGRSPRKNYSLYLDDIIEGYCKGKYLSEIYNIIKIKGFNGSQRGLTARFSRLFKKKKGYLNEIYKSSSTEYLNISPRKLSIYLTNKNYQEILSQTEISYYDGLKKDNSKLSCLWELSIEFREVFKSKSSLNLNKWIEKVKNTSLKKLNSFANGLTEDLDAVNAAVELEANNGLTENNVNRLKNIKRQMYGRASFNLLRRKVVLSMTG